MLPRFIARSQRIDQEPHELVLISSTSESLDYIARDRLGCPSQLASFFVHLKFRQLQTGLVYLNSQSVRQTVNLQILVTLSHQFASSPSIEYRTSSIKHRVSSIEYPVSSIQYPVSRLAPPKSNVDVAPTGGRGLCETGIHLGRRRAGQSRAGKDPPTLRANRLRRVG